MNSLKTLLANPKAQILAFGGALLLLGAIAWGIGWTAHGLLDRPDAQPVETITTAFPATQAPPPTSPPPSPTVPTPTGTSQPTSTPAPTLAPPAPAEEWEFVQPGEGLFMICRRHCPQRWPPDDTELTEYAQQVARLNNLPWPNPQLDTGQKLQMPPCP